MAFRIEDSVVRGEIDNRIKGTVQGKIWIEGRAEPVVLKLQGNACPDLAGCLLTFVNPQPRIRHPHLDSLDPLQRGTVGDLTASRKVRAFDIPLEEALAMIRRKEKPPEHMANCVYLEWYSQANGRVVIESTDFEITISPPEWRMTSEEDALRAKDSAGGMMNFLQQLTNAVEKQRAKLKDPEDDWDEHDYEQFFKERDASLDKYMELLDKYGDSEEAHEKIAQEMGWNHAEDESEVLEDGPFTVEELNAMTEAALSEPEPEPPPEREGLDWMRTSDGDLRHPLQHRCMESVLKFMKRADALELDDSKQELMEQFLFEWQMTSAKLAGALGPIARDASPPEPAFTVAYLKRALQHLHNSQSGLESVADKKLLPEDYVKEARQELFKIREGILHLMEELRGRH